MTAMPKRAVPLNGLLRSPSLTLLCAAAAALSGCARFQDKLLSPEVTAERLESRSLADAALRPFLSTNLHRQFAEWPLKQWDFEALALAAFYFHPSLDLARAQWASARAGISTAGGRPNPVLSATPGYSANPPRGVSPWFPTVTIDVPIETAGKRRHRITHAEHISESARLAISTAAWQVRSALRSAVLDYSIALARSNTLREQIKLQEQALQLLQQRLAAGAASMPELGPARIALLKLQTDVFDSQRLAREARARIAEAVGIPLRGIEGAEFAINSEDFAPEFNLETLRHNALLSRADILSALVDYSAAQSALQLEIAKQFPDVHLSPGYQYDQGENKWSLGLSVELPLLNQNQGPIAEARARRDEAAARFVALQAKIIAEIDRAQIAAETAGQQLRQTEQLIDLQREQVRMLEQALNAGGADQYELAAARLELAAAESVRLDARARQLQAQSLIESAVQRPFSDLDIIQRDPKTDKPPANARAGTNSVSSTSAAFQNARFSNQQTQ